MKIQPEEFVRKCLHPGIEQGMHKGDNLTKVVDIVNMDKEKFSQSFILHYHVN
jgi:hypothetical protein